MNAYEIYKGSDGEATRRLYAHLETLGHVGVIAMNLFRAQKTSDRAKKYRGGNARGSYRSQSYETKNWSLGQLVEALIVAEDLPMNARELSAESIEYWRDWKAGTRKVAALFISDPAQPPPFALGKWGWKEDANQAFHKWVLYVELPTGQVSFHAASPSSPHRYAGEWDGQHLSAERILRFVQSLL